MGEKAGSVDVAVEGFLGTLQTIYAQGQRVLELDVRGPSGLDHPTKEKLMRIFLHRTGTRHPNTTPEHRNTIRTPEHRTHWTHRKPEFRTRLDLTLS